MVEKLKDFCSRCYLGIIVVFLYAPILVLIVLSFNNSRSRVTWGGFTLDWYKRLLMNSQIMEALGTTLVLAFASAFIATVIGVLAALGINAMRQRNYQIMMAATNIPMLNADIVTGIALMIGFSLLVYYGLVYPGFDPEERNTMQIIAIVQGNILQYVTHKPLPLFARIATSAGIGLAVVSTVILYHIINVRINASRKKRSEMAGTKYANYCVGVLPFLIKVLKYKGVIKSARVGAKRAEYNCEQI